MVAVASHFATLIVLNVSHDTSRWTYVIKYRGLVKTTTTSDTLLKLLK